MNLLRSALLLPRGIGCSSSSVGAMPCGLFGAGGGGALWRAPVGGAVAWRSQPWGPQQVRGVKRGTEYQPKNIKRLRTHGWAKRTSTRGGIEVILRRMLKGRKSLTV